MRPKRVWPSPRPITPAAVAAEKQAASLAAPRLAPQFSLFISWFNNLLGHIRAGAAGCLAVAALPVHARGCGEGDRGRTKYRRQLAGSDV